MELSTDSMRGETRKAIIDFMYELPMVMLLELYKVTQEELENLRVALSKDDIFKISLDNLNSQISKHELETKQFPKMAAQREQHKEDSKKMKRMLIKRKNNFPVSKSGKYTKKQAIKFTSIMIQQQLVQFYKVKELIPEETKENFKTVWMRSLVVFYKYYLDKRSIKKDSDFGDLFHVGYFPYCNVVVTEADLSNTLNKIKKNDDIFKNTTIYSYSDFKNIINF